MLLHLLAVGDVVAQGGLDCLHRHLRRLKKEHDVHFTVVNGENAAGLALLPRQVLAMATRDGARALGRRTGQIAPGYTADLILVDFDRPSLTPCHSVEDNLVYSARGSDVVMNMARGKIIYKDGTFFTLDLERIKAEVETYALPLLFGDDASLADRRN